MALAPFGDLLKSYRSRRKLSQQELARRLGKHLNTIGSWERGERLPDTKAMVLELARVLHLEEEETRQLLEASLTSLSSYWSVPAPRNPFFTGRRELLARLHTQLTHQQPVAVSQSYALSGLGGIGKTQLALEYAYQHAHQYHAVFWVAAETTDTLAATFTAIADLLQIPEAQGAKQQQVVEAVLRWLSTHKDWLLIFDNVEDLGLLKAYLPAARQGAVLLTTRLHSLEGLAQPLELPAFSRAEALRFLLARAHLADPSLPLDEVPREVLRVATTLVKAMDGLPLALDQAGAYLERTGCGLSEYLRLYRRYRGRLLAERSPVAEHPHSVTQTFLLSFEQVAQNSLAASELLRLCALLHPDAIPEELLTGAASHWSLVLQEAVTDPFAFEQTLAELLRLSLVKRSAEQRALSLHRLVQAVLLETVTGEEQHQWLARAIAALDLLFPEGEEHANWNQCERLLPHALLCLQRAQAEQEDLALASLAFKGARYLYERGRYAEAEPLYQRARRTREQLLGAEHAEVAAVLYKLALIYREQGKYAEAEPLFQRALHIWEQQVGSEHQMSATLYGLARTYLSRGKYAEAEPLFQHALHIREQEVGPEHPQVAPTLNGLATLYFEQGRYVEAEPLFLRALAIYEQQKGPEPPEVVHPLNNLAILYAEQGKYAEAEPLLLRALRIWEQQAGPEHPNLAFPLTNLADLRLHQGRYDEAEPLYERALRIWEQQLGPEHPLVAYPLHGLAGLYQAQGRFTEAEALYLRVLAIRERSLEPQHATLADTLHEFATLRTAQENFLEAASLFQRALAIREQVLGPDHPQTIQTRDHLRAVRETRDGDQVAAGRDVGQPEGAES